MKPVSIEPCLASRAFRASNRCVERRRRARASSACGDVPEHLERDLRAVDVGLEVPQVGVRPDLLLAGDLAGRDLVEQLLGAVRDLERLEREVAGVDLVDSAAAVYVTRSVGGGLALGRRQRHVGLAAVRVGRRAATGPSRSVPAAPGVALGEVGLAERRAAGRGRRTTRRRARCAPSGRGSARTARVRRRRRPLRVGVREGLRSRRSSAPTWSFT